MPRLHELPLLEDEDTIQHNTQKEKTRLVLRGQGQPGSRPINPLYIGVPIAGMFLLLAIILFAIYILRRHNQYLDEYHYHESLAHARVVAQKRLPPSECHRNCPYPDGERSSSGSETKLLMKV